jgi:hypothetical protein
MPTNAVVRVNTVRSTVRGNSNMLELTGYDATNRRGFKKVFFETKKDGGLTKNAETANGLKQDDWVNITMDDSSYLNVQSIQRCAEPEGVDVPSQAGGAPAASGGVSGGTSTAPKADKMSKAEWAAKQAREALNIARDGALKAAVRAVSGDGKGFTKPKMEQVIKLSLSFAAFLFTGDFNGVAEITEPVVEVVETPAATTTRQPGDDAEVPINEINTDDDIPF